MGIKINDLSKKNQHLKKTLELKEKEIEEYKIQDSAPNPATRRRKFQEMEANLKKEISKIKAENQR